MTTPTNKDRTGQPPAKAPEGPPDPWASARGDSRVAYLLHHGWYPEGDPGHPDTPWIDPTKPTEAREEKIQVGTRKLPDGKVVPVFQTLVTPAVFPCTMSEAIAEQQRRDRAAKRAS